MLYYFIHVTIAPGNWWNIWLVPLSSHRRKKPPLISDSMLPGEPFQERFLGWSVFIFYNKKTETVVKNVDASTVQQEGNSSVTCSSPELGQKDKSISSYHSLNNEGDSKKRRQEQKLKSVYFLLPFIWSILTRDPIVPNSFLESFIFIWLVSSVLSQIQPAAAHDFRGQSSLQKIKYHWAGLKSTKDESKYFFTR